MQTETQVTAANVAIGLAVIYRKAPKAVPFQTQVISKPRRVNGVICVNVAMVGEPVPLTTLTKMHDEEVNND